MYGSSYEDGWKWHIFTGLEGCLTSHSRSCDLLSAPLSGDYDIGVMRALLQVLGPEDCRTVLRNIRPALSPGARLCILGQIVDDDRVIRKMSLSSI